MSWRTLVIAAAVAATVPAAAHAGSAGCDRLEGMRAGRAVDTVRSWADAFDWYKAHSQCDRGVSSEAFGDAVVSLLADRWSAFPSFVIYSRRDPGFKRFVLAHLNAQAGLEELRRMRKNAAENCLEEAKDLCAEIVILVDAVPNSRLGDR